MIDSAIGAFDFAALDDLAFAAERGRLNEDAIPALNAQEIGPVLELVRLSSQSRLLPTPQTASWLVLDDLSPMMQALDNRKELWVCPRTHLVGFLRTSMSSLKDETIWTRFGLSAQQAATRAGFPKRIAAQLVAAIGELHSNIYEHSEAPGTGLIAYRACLGQFELAVSGQRHRSAGKLAHRARLCGSPGSWGSATLDVNRRNLSVCIKIPQGARFPTSLCRPRQFERGSALPVGRPRPSDRRAQPITDDGTSGPEA